MATSIVTGDILSIRAWVVNGRQAAVNTYNFDCISVTGGAVTDQDVVNDLHTAFDSFYLSLCPPTVDYKGIQCYFAKRTGGYPNPVKNTSGAGAGTGGTTCAPLAIAGIMKYNTVFRGPGGRGRVYLPFFDAGFIGTDGEPSTAWNVLVNSWASGLLPPHTTTVGGNNVILQWGVMKKATRTTVASIHQIISAESAEKFGNMHKRGDYGRANESPI